MKTRRRKKIFRKRHRSRKIQYGGQMMQAMANKAGSMAKGKKSGGSAFGMKHFWAESSSWSKETKSKV